MYLTPIQNNIILAIPKVLTAELTMISLDADTHMSIIVIEPKYYLISSIDKKFPEGSLNHAIFGLP
jgi:hypothetical protein